MQFDLSRTIARLLAAAAGSGVLSGCVVASCPDDLPGSSSVPQGARAELETALTELQVHICNGHCHDADVPSGATCTPVPEQGLLGPNVVCAVSGPSGVEQRTWLMEGVDELVDETINASCDDVCRDTPAHADAEAAGQGDLPASCYVEGALLDDYAINCSYADTSNCGAGRAPAGLLPPLGRSPATSPLGAYWASMAFLEQASILAFEQLAAELQHHGAPTELVHRALAAADDERVHADLCGALAARHGAVPEPVRVTPVPPLSLLEIALHNRRHGCVAESFAALQACWQAARTVEPAARAALERIGRDETRHGQLAWDIDAWARTALDSELHPLLDRERDLALVDLVAQAPASAGPLLAPVGLHQPLALREVALAFCDDVRAAA